MERSILASFSMLNKSVSLGQKDGQETTDQIN